MCHTHTFCFAHGSCGMPAPTLPSVLAASHLPHTIVLPSFLPATAIWTGSLFRDRRKDLGHAWTIVLSGCAALCNMWHTRYTSCPICIVVVCIYSLGHGCAKPAFGILPQDWTGQEGMPAWACGWREMGDAGPFYSLHATSPLLHLQGLHY